MAAIEGILTEGRVPWFYDDHGNMVVGVENKKALLKILAQKSATPLRIMMAHTDHPGFHGVRWVDEKTLAIKWFGGSPKKYLNRAQVWLADSDGAGTQGRLTNIELASHGFSIDKAEVKISQPISNKHIAAKHIFGGFKFHSPFWRAGNLLYTRAADDLAGVFCIVETAKKLFQGKRKNTPSFIGLLTRAEEVGFIGAMAHFNLGWYARIQRPLLCVSLEASRTLEGAEIGNGPVVRLGDRRTVFSAAQLQALTELAQRHLKGEHQRRIMDGGACEGSATTMLGFPTIGISIPLGNYHNEGYQGGPDCRGPRGPAPEYVHIKDIERTLKLCIALAEDDKVWANPWQESWARLQKNFTAMKKHL